jgi:hydrogenase expression/formation protein HypC
MCIGIPVQVIEVKGLSGLGRDGERPSASTCPHRPGPPGTWVLNFLGAAREVLDPDEALKIRAAVGAVRSVMNGGDVGDAFADIEDRGPQLPPICRPRRTPARQPHDGRLSPGRPQMPDHPLIDRLTGRIRLPRT